MTNDYLSFLKLNFLSQGPNKSCLFSLVINEEFKVLNLKNKEEFSVFINSKQNLIKEQKKELKNKLFNCDKNVEKRELINQSILLVDSLITEITSIGEKVFYHEKSDVKNSVKRIVSNVQEVQNLLKKIDYNLNVDVIVDKQFDNLLNNLAMFESLFEDRQNLYKNVEHFLLDNKLFFSQVFINSFEKHDYEIVFSIETAKNPDILIFLHGEVYNYLRNTISNKINFSLNTLRDDYMSLVRQINELTVSEFLCKLDLINLRKDFLLDNKVFYYQYISSYILDLIEKFKLSEKKIINSIKYLVNNLESKKNLINTNLFSHQDVIDFCIKNALEKKVVDVLKISNEELNDLIKKSITDVLTHIENPQDLVALKIPKKIAIIFNSLYNKNIILWKKQFLSKNQVGELVAEDSIKINNKVIYNNHEYYEHLTITDSDHFISETFFKEKIPFNKSIYSFDVKVKNNGLIGQEWNIQYSFFTERYYKRE